MEKDTVSMHFVDAAVARLAPALRSRVLASAGIPAHLLQARDARVPSSSFAALWLAVAQAIDDEFFALDRRRMKVGSFALLCHAALPCAALERAMLQILRGFAVFLDDVAGDFAIDRGQALITVRNRIGDPADRQFADETFLVMVHGLMCWLIGKRIALAEAEFAHPRPAHASEYALMFCEHQSFDRPASAIRFEAELLSAPVVQNARSLKAFLHSAPQSVFLKYRNQDSWTARVRRRLRGGIDGMEWPVLETMAHDLHLAPGTLRRRLEAEGSSYQGIKDQLRRDAAIHYLCNNSLAIAEVGRLLGFQETSAFHRAFKKWTGVRPGEYRQGRLSRSGVRGQSSLP